MFAPFSCLLNWKRCHLQRNCFDNKMDGSKSKNRGVAFSSNEAVGANNQTISEEPHNENDAGIRRICKRT